MIVKGKISAIYEERKTAEIILTEFHNAVTAELSFYRDNITGRAVGDNVIIAVFGEDFNDAVIL